MPQVRDVSSGIRELKVSRAGTRVAQESFVTTRIVLSCLLISAFLVAKNANAASKEPAKKAPAVVIHSRRGDKPVETGKNVAISRVNGGTIVGRLESVKKGTVEVTTSKARLRIAESDITDAANF